MTPRIGVDPPTPNASEVLERLAQEVSQLAFYVKETVTTLREEEGAVKNGRAPGQSRNGSAENRP